MLILRDLWAVTLALHPEGTPFLDLKAGPGTSLERILQGLEHILERHQALDFGIDVTGTLKKLFNSFRAQGKPVRHQKDSKEDIFLETFGVPCALSESRSCLHESLILLPSGFITLYIVWNCFFGYPSRAFFWTFLE